MSARHLPSDILVVFALVALAIHFERVPYTTAFHQGSFSLSQRTLSRSLRCRSSCITKNPRHQQSHHRLDNWVGDLWSEIIEFSTYGPGERKLIAERRKAAEAAAEATSGGQGKVKNQENVDDLSTSAFLKAKKKFDMGDTTTNDNTDNNDDVDYDLSPEDFKEAASAQSSSASATIASSTGKNPTPEEGSSLDDFDGYALRDLLVSKWGAQLDIDFQRNTLLSCVYCNVLPIAFGQKRCRHESELSYLMHLQGIIEILRKYDNLEMFVDFVGTTNKVPRAGTDSVPFRLQLTEEQLEKIL